MSQEYRVTKNRLTGKPFVRFDCPHCSENLKSSLEDAGQQDVCPQCAGVFLMPGTQELAEFREEESRLEAEKEAATRAKHELAEEKKAQATRMKLAKAAAERQRQIDQDVAESRAASIHAAQRAEYLQTYSRYRKKYKVVMADTPEQAEQTCNYMGYEGWDLEQALTDTSTYAQCCGTTSKRQFVLVFSQPLEPDQD